MKSLKRRVHGVRVAKKNVVTKLQRRNMVAFSYTLMQEKEEADSKGRRTVTTQGKGKGEVHFPGVTKIRKGVKHEGGKRGVNLPSRSSKERGES